MGCVSDEVQADQRHARVFMDARPAFRDGYVAESVGGGTLPAREIEEVRGRDGHNVRLLLGERESHEQALVRVRVSLGTSCSSSARMR